MRSATCLFSESRLIRRRPTTDRIAPRASLSAPRCSRPSNSAASSCISAPILCEISICAAGVEAESRVGAAATIRSARRDTSTEARAAGTRFAAMRSRAWPISRKEKIATAAPTTDRPLIPRKASNSRFATPSCDGTHARSFGLGNAIDRLDLPKLMSAPRPQLAKRPRERTVIRQRDRAARLHAYESKYVPAAARFKYQPKAQEPAALRDFDPAFVRSGSKGEISRTFG